MKDEGFFSKIIIDTLILGLKILFCIFPLRYYEIPLNIMNYIQIIMNLRPSLLFHWNFISG